VKSNNGANSALAVLIAINILNFYDRNVVGRSPSRSAWNQSDGHAGRVTRQYLHLAVRYCRRTSRQRGGPLERKKMLTGGIVVWSALTAMAALATSYALLLCSRLGFAVGEAAVAPTATSWIGDMYPPEKRARPLALFMIGVPVGGL